MLWSIIKNITRKAAGTPDVTTGDDLQARGIERLNAGDLPAAHGFLSAAHAADPEDGDASYYLALAEARSGRLERAEELLDAAHTRRDDADVNNALGNVQRLRGNLDKAAASYQRALEFDGRHLAALANLGLTLRDQGTPEQALRVLDRVLEIAPDHVEALFNKALALGDLGEGGAAGELIEKVLQLDPDFAQAHLQRGFTLLRRGDFAAGWREYAWRVRIPDLDHWQDYDYPLWQGEALAGKRVLVQAEQGLGDQIMFASCLPDILALARHVAIECDPRLAKLFARSFPQAVVYRYRVAGEPDWRCEPAPDFRVRCGDLPRMLRNRADEFPRHGGYLIADPARAADWRTRLAALGPGLKVGISWRGGTPGTGRAARSLALDALLPILSLPRAHFVSLQYGEVEDEIADLRARHGVILQAGALANANMDDVAALIAGLDLVITVCTTVAHLAGALGKTAWVMVPSVTEWRYLETGASIPWYPTLRLFRQQHRNQWNDLISMIRTELINATGKNSR